MNNGDPGALLEALLARFRGERGGKPADYVPGHPTHRKVNVEPTGEALNSIIELGEDHLPYNPMINSGAIAMSALLHHADPEGASRIAGALELRARQCTVAASTRELALMAATLANGGIHPPTQRRAIRREHLRGVLTLMFTCGMYESGGSGGILAVVPGRMGLAAYSPRLDRHGHSVRCLAVFRAWSAAWRMNLFEAMERTP